MMPVPPTVEVTVALEPVYNILMTMAALRTPEDYGGADEWVVQTERQFTPELRARHTFLMRWVWLDALTNAVERGPATASFPAYLAALAAQDAVALRNRILDYLIHSVHLRVFYDALPAPAIPADLLLADVDKFTGFWTQRVRGKDDLIDTADVADFHRLLNAPAQLQGMLITHLQTMWQTIVEPEWVRVQPHLQACVDAFAQIPLTGLTMLEAMQLVTGRDLRPVFRLKALWTYRQVRFIPNTHNGPYVVWFGNDTELRIGFPARFPANAASSPKRLAQSTFVNRYKALADETRLAILLALYEVKTLSTQEIIDRFELDKSAASRHLRQLVATSLIEEQRAEGAKKVYQLNQVAIEELIQMLSGFLR